MFFWVISFHTSACKGQLSLATTLDINNDEIVWKKKTKVDCKPKKPMKSEVNN